jgi:hypothetical protein
MDLLTLREALLNELKKKWKKTSKGLPVFNVRHFSSRYSRRFYFKGLQNDE